MNLGCHFEDRIKFKILTYSILVEIFYMYFHVHKRYPKVGFWLKEGMVVILRPGVLRIKINL